jgi:sugar phosphate isomerase/epimerase
MTRFGYRTAGFPGWPVEKAAAQMAQLGYGSVEICLEGTDVRPELMDSKRCAEIRRTVDSLGMNVASVSYHGDSEAPADRLANQHRAIEVAHRLGVDILVINSERTIDHARQWAEHVERFKTLCAAAAGLGVRIAVEPEPLLVVGSSQDMLDMLALVNSPALKVNFDVGHAQVTDDDPAASIRLLGSAIVHVHLEDIKDRVHRHLIFGDGDIDFVAMRQALSDVQFNGPLVVDLFGREDPVAAAQHAIAALQTALA